MNKTIHIAILSAFVGTATFATAQSNLSVPLRVQEHSNWCWAASSKMVLDFKGKSVTQCQIVNWAVGINYACGNNTFTWNSPANKPNSTYKITQILNNYGVPANQPVQNYLSWAAVTANLNASKPFIILKFDSPSSNVGHFVVCKGYTGTSTLYINDPWPNEGSYTRAYNAFTSVWKWTNTLR